MKFQEQKFVKMMDPHAPGVDDVNYPLPIL
jgi:hypothetical protein